MSDEAKQSEDQAYFLAIEKVFIELRGAPLLLSPGDWRLAQAWRREGIPLHLIEESLETLFRRREERGAKGRVQSLRYCRDAVEAAWRELQELVEPGRRGDGAPGVDVDERLQSLAAALPAGEVVDALDLRRRLESMRGTPGAIERSLGELELELFEALAERLEPEERRRLDERIDGVLAALPEPLASEARERAAERLRRQILRRRAGLPHLTLFG